MNSFNIATTDQTNISAIIEDEDENSPLLILSHGAGADMEHEFMQRLAKQIVSQNLGVLRFNFPYMDAKKKSGARFARPDPKNKLLQTLDHVIRWAGETFPNRAIVLGGKSMGGRMSSLYCAENPEVAGEIVKGLIFIGFPLHQPKKPDIKRSLHLSQIGQPMLFLQGTRDQLADMDLIKSVTGKLQTSTLEIFDNSDHSFKVLKRSGIDQDSVYLSISNSCVNFINKVCK